MNKQIESLQKLKSHILSNDSSWEVCKSKATTANPWFTDTFINSAIHAIAHQYLQEDVLINFAQKFNHSSHPHTVGLIMAGNIPMVGFHDFLCVYLSGHAMKIKFSSKDNILMPYIIEFIKQHDTALVDKIICDERLTGCNAYIATGSNTSMLYFKKYFAAYPHILRGNKTSVAVLDGTETDNELALLADDVHLYFGLGCRNITKIYVPDGYNFEKLLSIFSLKYDYLKHHNKYRNNYDYQLALCMINQVYYMTNGSILLVENEAEFSAVSALHYSFYKNKNDIYFSDEIQGIIGNGYLPFGSAQAPTLTQFADDVNTIDFLNSL